MKKTAIKKTLAFIAAMSITASLAACNDEGIKQASFNGTDWGSTRESLNGMTNTAVEEINNKIADFS